MCSVPHCLRLTLPRVTLLFMMLFNLSYALFLTYNSEVVYNVLVPTGTIERMWTSVSKTGVHIHNVIVRSESKLLLLVNK